MLALKTEHIVEKTFAASAARADVHGESWTSAHAWPAGIELFAQGSRPSAVHQLDQGLVKLTRVQTTGREVIIGLRRAPWMLGAAEVLLERSYATTATALQSCRVRCLSAGAFRRLVRADARTSWWVHRMLSREVCDQAQLAALACLPGRRRLEHFLEEMAQASDVGATDGWVRLRMPLTQQELAQLLAVTREHLNRMLKRLEGEGRIRRRKGWLWVCDRAEGQDHVRGDRSRCRT